MALLTVAPLDSAGLTEKGRGVGVAGLGGGLMSGVSAWVIAVGRYVVAGIGIGMVCFGCGMAAGVCGVLPGGLAMAWLVRLWWSLWPILPLVSYAVMPLC